MHGTGDQLTSAEASQEFASKAGENVHIKLYNGLYHEIHNEPEKEKVFQDILSWFESHL
jgi:acylglycerol lipase